MSTTIEQGDGTAAQSSYAPPSMNRTWRSSQDIAFAPAKGATWGPHHGLRFSSSSASLTTPHIPLSENTARQSLENGTVSLSTKHRATDGRLDFQLSQNLAYPVLSMSGSSSGPSMQDDALYPALDPFLTTQQVEPSASEDLKKAPERNDTDKSPTLTAEGPFYSPLGFHIPKARLQNALNATPPNPSAFWQYTLYRGPGGDKDTVKVHYCKDKEKTETIAKLFLEEEVIGFDLEWKVNPKDDSIKKNVALVQVASEQRVALFHLARYANAQGENDFISPSFRKLLESPDITKVGVNVKGDSTRLRNFLHIECRGLFELSHLYKLVKFSTADAKKVNRTLVSLASQVQEHLQLPLWKGEVRSSDWSQELSYLQTQYAASDSYAGLQLYHVLESKRKAMDPMPPRPAHAELNIPIRLANGQTVATLDESPEITKESDENSLQTCDVSIEELTHDIRNISLEYPSSEYDPEISLAPTATSEASSAPLSAGDTPGGKSISLPSSPELDVANEWVKQYSQTRAPQATKSAARPADLRAYALWHEQGLNVPTVAKLLRVPPLHNTTIVTYIGKAISSEMLPYESSRFPELEQYAGAYGLQGVLRKKPAVLGGEHSK